MTALISKCHGPLTLIVAPALGGSIAALRWHGADILRPLPQSGEQRVNLGGGYPLIPYANRIAGGRFTFDGRSVELEKNFGDHPHSIHGNGWQSAWQLMEEDATSLTLGLTHSAQGETARCWPWPWRAVQRFSLTDDTLDVRLSYENLAASDVPVGLGFHPYFAHADRSLVQFCAQQVLVNDANSLPASSQSVPERWDYSTFRRPVAGSVDNCFTGWSGESRIRWPEHKIEAAISAPGTTNAVFFIPPAEKNVVAIEPVTHINNAINILPPDPDDSRAMQRVAAGDGISIQMTIRMSHYD